MRLVSLLVLFLTGCIYVQPPNVVTRDEFDTAVTRLIENDKIFADAITKLSPKEDKDK